MKFNDSRQEFLHLDRIKCAAGLARHSLARQKLFRVDNKLHESAMCPHSTKG